MTKTIWIFTTTVLLFSCGQHTDKKDGEITVKENVSTTVSTKLSELEKLINFANFKPVQAKFKYVLYNNSGQDKRLTVPGPSDSYLQAILYFDNATFTRFRKKYDSSSYQSPGYDKQDFNFDWLDVNIKKELASSDTNYHGHPDYFFGLGQSGKLWLLDNKVLLTKATN